MQKVSTPGCWLLFRFFLFCNRLICHCDIAFLVIPRATFSERRTLLKLFFPSQVVVVVRFGRYNRELTHIMFRRVIIGITYTSLLLLNSISSSRVTAQDDALKDVQIGMQGLKQASDDPAVLAQLMKDLQDPELMAEAQKMMQDPAFQREMKRLTKSKEFQETVKKTKDMMNDPNTAAHAEARMEHMLRVGQEQLQKGAKLNLEQLLSEIGSDPDAMRSMQKMLQDPSFKKQFDAMTKDNQFQTYVDAMKELMKDPAKKKYIETLGAQLKKAL
jgi:hypothetical protein